MADLTINGGTRPKPEVDRVISLPIGLLVATSFNSGVCDSLVQLETLTPNPETFVVSNCGTTVAGKITNGLSTAFNNVRKGDAVSGTGIDTGCVVTAITVLNSGLTELTVAPVPLSTGSGRAMTFTPPTFSPTFWWEKREFSMNGSVLKMRLRLWQSDGKLNRKADSGSGDAITIDQLGAPLFDQTFSLNTDTWLTNARVAQSAT